MAIAVALIGLAALVQSTLQMNLPAALLGAVLLVCAVTTYRSSAISSFLKIFVGIFSAETVVFGLAVVAARAGFWPSDFAQEKPPESLSLTVAVFSILVYVVARFPTVGQIMRIADRYFNAGETAPRCARPPDSDGGAIATWSSLAQRFSQKLKLVEQGRARERLRRIHTTHIVARASARALR